jgi:hypothetical protein
MRIALMLITLAAGCAPPLPHNRPVEPPPHAAEAVYVVRDFLSAELSYQLGGELLPEFRGQVVWMRGRCLDFDRDWVSDIFWRYDVECAEGLYRDEVIFALVEPSISDTMLTHGLVHYWLDMLTGDPDYDRATPVWWDLVQPANGAIKRMEQSYEEDDEEQL